MRLNRVSHFHKHFTVSPAGLSSELILLTELTVDYYDCEVIVLELVKHLSIDCRPTAKMDICQLGDHFYEGCL